MPTAKGTQPTPSMKDEQKPYAERIREQYDTTNLAAIMGRFYNAVSGGSD